ncbi:nuclear transport factor 2 family protein [Aeromicrobium sp. Leaf272]|uniref:nuclear transport factor 2 family protein n=1 Tax=Aeromicrobium sp. Leaf272 TaxID=1736317 RepID=UPI000701229F|nr:nuclear transport factor 2 family protein [Aeromicrobium sp. Leaf272]KQP27648.1 hypothetical protein ASF38_01900 [Aeromicrobium sp. Leaf272]
MAADVLARHRAFYDAVESGDLDLMSSLWVDSPSALCVHPGAEAIEGTDAVLRSWALVMANVEYIQFFLTDVQVSWPLGSEADLALVTCTENILSGEGTESPEQFSGGKAICTSVLVRSGDVWRLWSRHASPVLDIDPEAPEEPGMTEQP